MADQVPLTLTEGNDETVQVTITRLYMADDLVLIVEVVFYLADSDCTTDTAGALVLSSSNAAEVNITSHTSAQITADVFIPASALKGSYGRFYRVDGVTATGKTRTAVFGPVAVNAV